MTDREVDADFPSLNLHPDRVLYRVHRAANDPLYFSSTGIGRFDLARIAGMGTCYLSASPIGAYVETLGRLGTPNRGDVHERRLSELTPSRTLRVGDLTDRTILGMYGITGDLSVGADYRPAQELSRRLCDHGFDGVYYTVRHDPAFTERCRRVRRLGREEASRSLYRSHPRLRRRPRHAGVRAARPSPPNLAMSVVNMLAISSLSNTAAGCVPGSR